MNACIDREQRGVSIIELMIASTISILVISSVIFAFTSTHRSYKLQSQQRQIQENGQYALEILRHDIRMAGYAASTYVQQQ